jgi:hypothetical protein
MASPLIVICSGLNVSSTRISPWLFRFGCRNSSLRVLSFGETAGWPFSCRGKTNWNSRLPPPAATKPVGGIFWPLPTIRFVV